MNPNAITASRLKQLRENRNMSQETFAQSFAEYCQRDTKYSIMTLSNWETGRKLPTTEVIVQLARYYEVTTDYILGLSNDETKTSKDIVVSIDQRINIKFNDLPKYDKQPVYVKFPDSNQLQNQFGILDWSRQSVQFTNNTIIAAKPEFLYYICMPPEELTIRNQMKHLLNLRDIKTLEQVYIQSLSSDPYTQGVISGWYRNDVSGKFLINDLGRTLSYEGLGVTYNAMNFKLPTKKTAK